MEKIKLNSKIIIVTGAAGLIRRAFCLEIAKADVNIIIADVNKEKEENIEDRINKYN